jgi:hypothetical protein
MPLELVEEGLLDSPDPAFQSALAELGTRYDASLVTHPLYGRCLVLYLVLTDHPDLVANLGLSNEQMFWSRYFWFGVFTKLALAVDGPNAGLEQQAHQILEHPQPDCDPDWSFGERVTHEIDRIASLRLSAWRDSFASLRTT